MAKKCISIIGATGVQGQSVINAVRRGSSYAPRAICRNPDSDKAKQLAAQGVEVVQADLNDLESLISAFKGSSAIYGVTNFFEPFEKYGAAKAVDIEVAQGINIAKAAAVTETLEHFIWSTLPDGRKISNGKYIVPHFDAKNQIDRYIRSNAALIEKTTFLWVAFYATNLVFPMFTPYYIPTAGKYIQIQDTPADTPIKTIGDARVNVGIFVQSILNRPELTLNGKFVLADYTDMTANEFLQAWATAQGKEAQYVQTDEKTYHSIWPAWAEEMSTMMQFWDWAREKSWSGEEYITKVELGIKTEELVSPEQAFASLSF
jgi:hypothetical protein